MTASGAERQEREAIEETAARLFVKLSLDPDPRERAEIYRWIAQADAHAVAFAQIEAAWQSTERLKAFPCGGLDVTDAPVPDLAASDGGNREALFTRRRFFAGIAAAASLALAFPLLQTQGSDWQDYTTGIGERRDIQLADGSVLHLNTGSRVDVRLAKDARLIRLRAGEASFDVAHDATRPFDVEAGGTVLRAVGTRFNVRMRKETVELTVTEGRVAIRRQARTLEVLDAGSGAVVRPDAVRRRRFDQADLSKATAWRRDEIELNGDTVGAAVAEFNRYRALPIVIADPRVGTMRIGGLFNTRDADNFIVALEGSLPIRAIRKGDGRVLLTYRK